ncbi:tetratricopeptide repeat (TPR)-like superfamily protein [Artemisia annua]|uniref:Tetratricopeptide repeat (TPR)-like superfamily protein n=1 Tax=Artemisia annua TaxID=35608 RepID=A0A2U1LIM0_ARTAN|nr:tetratricopeptide repeat (TPR)-like superfamily protein [Artemisia annua]
MADEEMADEEQQKGKRTIRTGKFMALLMIHGLTYLMVTHASAVHSIKNGISEGILVHPFELPEFQICFLVNFHHQRCLDFGPIRQALHHASQYPECHNLLGLVYEARCDYLSAIASYKVARGAVIISSGDTQKLLNISVNLARTFNGLTPYGRIVGDSGLEGLKVGQSRIEFGQILACGYNHTVLPQYKRMPSRAGTNSVDSEDDSGKSPTFIYHDSGISLATRVFMMLKMLHYSLRVFAG